MTELRSVWMELGRTDAGPVVLGRNNCVRLMLEGTRVSGPGAQGYADGCSRC